MLPARGTEAIMHENPKFWALFVAIWFGAVLGVLNLALKVNMLRSLAEYN